MPASQPIPDAIALPPMTEVCGMGNGLRSYVKQGVVDYDTTEWPLLGAVPATVVALLAHAVDPTLLELLFGAGLIILGTVLVYYDPPEDCEPGECEGAFLEAKNTGRGTTTIEAADGETFTDETCWRPPGRTPTADRRTWT